MTDVGTPDPGTPDPGTPDRIFYDGDCGMCHGAVTFLSRRDAEGRHFRFAPLGGETFTAAIPAEVRRALPDSLVLLTPEGTLRLRSDAVLHALRRLGGIWKVLGTLARLVPRPLRDVVYDLVARVRSRIFAKPAGVCPLLPPALRARFDP